MRSKDEKERESGTDANFSGLPTLPTLIFRLFLGYLEAMAEALQAAIEPFPRESICLA